MSAKVPVPKRVSSQKRKHQIILFLLVSPMSYFTRISALGLCGLSLLGGKTYGTIRQNFLAKDMIALGPKTCSLFASYTNLVNDELIWQASHFFQAQISIFYYSIEELITKTV